MSPNPRLVKVLQKTRSMDIPDKEAIRALKGLLEASENNWFLIENDNYQTLIATIYEIREDKELKNKTKGEMENNGSENPSKRLRLSEQQIQTSIVENSGKKMADEQSQIPFRINEKKVVTSQPCSQDNKNGYRYPLSSAKLVDKGNEVGSSDIFSEAGKSISRKKLTVVESQIPLPTFKKEVESFQTGERYNINGYKSPLSHAEFKDNGKKFVSSAIAVQDGNSRYKASGLTGEPIPNSLHKKELVEANTKKLVNRLTHSQRPISLVHPGVSEGSSRNHSVKSMTSYHEDIHDEDDHSPCTYSRKTRNNFSLASSPLGEVKILLHCESFPGQPNNKTPKLDEVLKFVEDTYLKSHNIVGPQFSVKKLMKDLCISYLKMGTGSPDRSFINNSYSEMVMHDNDAFHATGQKMGYLKNGCSVEPNGTVSSASNHKKDLAVQRQRAVVLEDNKKPHLYVDDITKGTEKVKISLVDEYDKEDLPKFNYIPQNIIFQDANINISLARIVDEDCCSSCSGDCLSSSITCACARETGGEFAYTRQGLLKEDFLRACISMNTEPKAHHFVYCQDCPYERSKNEKSPEQCKGHLYRKFIKECWRKCGCDMHCGNRVVQRGIACKLQVFMTHGGKGWGLRTLEVLPKGAFVCEYVGEIMTNTELYDRNKGRNVNERHTYPVNLDADWGSERILKDEEALCLDATIHGNVARFINHRCHDSNLIDIPVEVETPDRHYYHVAFFTTRKVNALEELSWDYGIDFHDQDHPVKAFQCCCGSSSCRDIKRKRSKGQLQARSSMREG